MSESWLVYASRNNRIFVDFWKLREQKTSDKQLISPYNIARESNIEDTIVTQILFVGTLEMCRQLYGEYAYWYWGVERWKRH